MPKLHHKSSSSHKSMLGALVSALKIERKKPPEQKKPAPVVPCTEHLSGAMGSPYVSSGEVLFTANSSRRRSLEKACGSSVATEVTLSELPRLDGYLSQGSKPRPSNNSSDEQRGRLAADSSNMSKRTSQNNIDISVAPSGMSVVDIMCRRSIHETLVAIMHRLEKIERAVIIQSADEETRTNSMRLQVRQLEEENLKLKEMLSSVYTGTHDGGAASSLYSRNSSTGSKFIVQTSADTHDGMYHHNHSSIGCDTPRILPLMVALGSQAGPTHEYGAT